jgi:tetratricopeptide (TPR) repeat protein
MAGWVAERRDDSAQAEREYRRVEELTRALGIGGHVAFPLILLGRLARRAGQVERARLLEIEAAALVDDGAAPWFAAFAHAALADSLVRVGDVGQAEELLRRAIAECPASGSPFSQERFFSLFGGSPAARARIALGSLVRARGDDVEANALLRAGVERAEADADPEALALGLEAIAASTAPAEPERAAMLLGSVATLRSAIRVPRDPLEQSTVTRTMSVLNEALGDSALTRAMRAGASLPVGDALRLARQSAIPVPS